MAIDNRFENRVAVITGGASGIGRATARRFTEEGASVVLADIDSQAGIDTAETLDTETPGSATFIQVDVTDDAAVEEMISTARSQYGSIDIGVNNAGVGSEGTPLAEIEPTAWQSILDVNLTGVWRCMAHEIEAMRERDGGVIVNTASILGQVGSPNAAAYTASKHGIVGLTKTAALEYASDNIRVNAICPGFTNTQLLNAADRLDEDVRAALKEEIPMKRFGEPEEIAAGIVWLCSDDSSFTNGATLAMDGGYLSQ